MRRSSLFWPDGSDVDNRLAEVLGVVAGCASAILMLFPTGNGQGKNLVHHQRGDREICTTNAGNLRGAHRFLRAEARSNRLKPTPRVAHTSVCSGELQLAVASTDGSGPW